jgi:hypothetical protein
MAVGVGAAGILVAAQLMAKPSTPLIAKGRAATPRAEGNSARQSDAETKAANKPEASVQVKPASSELRDLFRPLVVNAPPSQPKAQDLKPVIPTVKPVVVTPPAAPPRPAPGPMTSAPTGPNVNDLQMRGVVEMGDDVKVLLKHRTTGESRYFATGENAFGFTVGAIRATEVELGRNGRNEMVRMANTITIEGPSGSTSANASGIGGGGFGGGFGGGGFGGGRGGRRGGGRRGGGDGDGGGSGGGGDTGFSTASIFSLPTWTERLKKLEEEKSKIDPARYASLHKFMSERAKGEAKK